MPRRTHSTWWASLALVIAAPIASAQPAPEPSTPGPAPTADPLPHDPAHAEGAPAPTASPAAPTVASFEEEPWAPPAVTAKPEPPRDRYPRSLATRKPILPSGVLEASALLGVEVPDAAGDRERYTATPRLRLGIPHAEVAIGSSMLVHSTDTGAPAPERLGMLTANGRYMFLPGATVGAELTVKTPIGDTRKYSPRMLLGMKQRLGSRSAVDLVVAGGIDQAATDTATTRSLAAASTIRVQAQAAHGLAFEARGTLGYTKRMHDDPVMPVGAALWQDYGLRMVAGASPSVDFIVGFDLLGSGATAYKLVTAGIAVRRLP